MYFLKVVSIGPSEKNPQPKSQFQKRCFCETVYCPFTHHPHKPTIPTKPTQNPHIMTLYKPYIFWKLVISTIHWPTAHSPITHTDPPYPHNPPTTHILWQYLNFIMFYTIQIIYFLKAGDTHYPLIMNHSDDVDILQYCSSTGPSVSRFGIFFRAHRYFSGFWKFFII